MAYILDGRDINALRRNSLGGALLVRSEVPGGRVGDLAGFADYNDTSTTTTPLNLLADTWTVLPNDGLGEFTNLTYLPNDITQLLDVSTGAIDPTQLILGDAIFVRTDLRITPSVNGAFLQFRYALGTGPAAYFLGKQLGSLANGGGVEYAFQFVDFIYMGDENTRGNPIVLVVNCSEDATFTNLGTVIQVFRR